MLVAVDRGELLLTGVSRVEAVSAADAVSLGATRSGHKPHAVRLRSGTQ